MPPRILPFKISALVFVHNARDELLLIKRAKKPNLGCWSPIGGKLEMTIGESPYECAKRETGEEIGLTLADKDLHCFGYVSEKSYEGGNHWLMFLFNCLKPLNDLPPNIDEGVFGFFERSAIEALPIPHTDRTLLWPYYDQFAAGGFVGLRADCGSANPLQAVEELIIHPTDGKQ